MFKAMMDENKEMRKTIQEMIPKIGDQNSHNTNINNNFNINLFLNETCKDAVNLMISLNHFSCVKRFREYG